MNLNRLKEIEARVNNTTQGKWLALNIPFNRTDDPEIVTEDGTYIAQTVYDMQSTTTKHKINEDTLFIANAKEDILFLIEEIYKLLEEK